MARKSGLNTEAFAQRLRRYLETENQTQRDVARRMEVSDSTLSGWLTGRSAPENINTLIKLEEATNIPLSTWIALLRDQPHNEKKQKTVTAAELAAVEMQLAELKKRIG